MNLAFRTQGTSVLELAAHANSLKANNTIKDAAPRGEHKLISAEEPVIARIRRREEEATEVLPQSDQHMHPTA